MTPGLQPVVQDFLEHKRAIGRKYISEERELRLLVRYADSRGASTLDRLTPALLDDFLGSRARSRPRSFNHLLGVVPCLLDWAVCQQLLGTSPLQTRRRRATSQRVPFLFDVAQARRLLSAAAGLPDNSRARQRGPTYHAVFALCYGLGLRAGEACGLRLGDVDFDRRLIVVRGRKFGKSRLVPHGPRIAELLADQVQRRRATGAIVGPQAPLFSFDGRTCLSPGTASQTFHHLVAVLDLAVPDGVSAPRLHDLRHSFAVGCLLRWYRDGEDPVAPATRSEVALAKVSRRSSDNGEALHSFATLLGELATLTRNTIVFANGARITKLAIPTPLQRRAFDLIGVPVPIELKAM